MARQAVHQRIDKSAVAFLLQVINDLLSNHYKGALDEFSSSGFKRIPGEHSTTFPLRKTNAELFPAHVNASGPTGGVKCNLCDDLPSQQPIALDPYRAPEQGRTIGREMLALARKGDLILRNMGYFNLS